MSKLHEIDAFFRAFRLFRLGAKRYTVRNYSGLSPAKYKTFYSIVSSPTDSPHEGAKVQGETVMKSRKSSRDFGNFLNFYKLLTGSYVSDIRKHTDEAITAYEMMTYLFDEDCLPGTSEVSLTLAFRALCEVTNGNLDVNVCGDCGAVVLEKDCQNEEEFKVRCCKECLGYDKIMLVHDKFEFVRQ